jgi:hypothetical protein
MAENPTTNDRNITILRYWEDDLVRSSHALAAAMTFGIFFVLSWTVPENAKT